MHSRGSANTREIDIQSLLTDAKFEISTRRLQISPASIQFGGLKINPRSIRAAVHTDASEPRPSYPSPLIPFRILSRPRETSLTPTTTLIASLDTRQAVGQVRPSHKWIPRLATAEVTDHYRRPTLVPIYPSHPGRTPSSLTPDKSSEAAGLPIRKSDRARTC